MISVNPAPALELAILPALELAPIIASAIHADSGKLYGCMEKYVISYLSIGVIYDCFIKLSNHSILIRRNNIHLNNFYYYYINYHY